TSTAPILTEHTLRLADVGQYLPPGRHGKRPSLSCVLRWVLSGVRLPSGATVRLQAVRCGGKWITSVEALNRFAAAQTPDLDTPRQTPTPRTTAARRRAADRAGEQLARAGI